MKKINSEIKLEDEHFKIKIGTTNKKYPDTVYVEMGSYIAPLLDKRSYEMDINNFEKMAKRYVKRVMDDGDACNHDFIFVTDVANERIMQGKKSYLEMQLYLKPTANTISNNDKDFKKISGKINSEYLAKIVPYLKASIANNGFEYSKTKA